MTPELIGSHLFLLYLGLFGCLVAANINIGAWFNRFVSKFNLRHAIFERNIQFVIVVQPFFFSSWQWGAPDLNNAAGIVLNEQKAILAWFEEDLSCFLKRFMHIQALEQIR